MENTAHCSAACQPVLVANFLQNLIRALQDDDLNVFKEMLERNTDLFDNVTQAEIVKLVQVIVTHDRQPALDILIDNFPHTAMIVHQAFVQSVHQDQLAFFQYVLEKFLGGKPNSFLEPQSDNSLLHITAGANKTTFAHHLLEIGADVNGFNAAGLTPLGVAVTKGYTEMTQMLIDSGALMTNTPSAHLLMLATHLGHFQIVELLLKCGLAQKESNQFKQNSLMIASKKGNAKIVNLLLDTGYEVECCDRFGYTPFMYAVVEGHIDVVRILLERGCNPLTKRWSAQDTALHFAASYGQLEIISLLLEHVSDPDVPDCIGITPLYLAAEEGHLEVVKMLAPKCNLYSMCGDKGRPLDAAVEYGNLDCIKYFLEHGDTVAMKDTSGRTPLMRAACRGHVDVVKFLLEENSDIAAKDDHGKTALSYAVLSMNPKCVELLLTEGATVDVVDSDGVSLFMIAIKVGQPAVVSLFVLAGADLDSKCRVNKALEPLRPIELAIRQENIQVIELLVNAGCTISISEISQHLNHKSLQGNLRFRLYPLGGQSSSTTSLSNDNEAVKSFLKKHSAQPYSLKCHCRKTIWRRLPRPFWCSVSELPLPSLIKDYLLMTSNG